MIRWRLNNERHLTRLRSARCPKVPGRGGSCSPRPSLSPVRIHKPSICSVAQRRPDSESGLSISSQRIRARKRASFITVIAQARFGTMRTSSAFCEPLRHIYAWRCLRNLGRFVDNPWAIPGHIELANGQIQATNQAGINLKYPFSAASTTSSVSSAVSTVTTRGSEFDLNPAQTQDQESYNILPVTDPDDLRRLARHIPLRHLPRYRCICSRVGDC